MSPDHSLSRPPPAAVEAFGGDGSALVRLAGGDGRSWRAGPVVLKPAADKQLVRWVSEFVGALQLDRSLRVAGPVPAANGDWIVDGWAATVWVEGKHLSGVWDRILGVSADFHAAAAATGIGPSAALTSRDDAWAVGDRVAWGEQPAVRDWPDAVHRLLDRLEPLVSSATTSMRRQVVHGDLGTNVLFADADRLGPAVIDISPYYRPAAWADAVVVADAVAWETAPLDLARRYVTRQPEGRQLLARAIVYRVVAAAIHGAKFPAAIHAELRAYRTLLPLLGVSWT